jgi:hypothetical protein
MPIARTSPLLAGSMPMKVRGGSLSPYGLAHSHSAVDIPHSQTTPPLPTHKANSRHTSPTLPYRMRASMSVEVVSRLSTI